MALTLVVVASAFATVIVARSAGASSSESAARAVASAFFRSIDARQFERTCELLSAEFFRKHRIRSKKVCAVSLRISFTWTPSYRFAIGRIHVDRDRATVAARANDARGTLELTREGGSFKVLDVRGS
jgi:hypothetical protein